MPSNETLEIDDNLSTSMFVHDIQWFHAIFVYTDFIQIQFREMWKLPYCKVFRLINLILESHKD